jgi:hypothetical protein
VVVGVLKHPQEQKAPVVLEAVATELQHPHLLPQLLEPQERVEVGAVVETTQLNLMELLGVQELLFLKLWGKNGT